MNPYGHRRLFGCSDSSKSSMSYCLDSKQETNVMFGDYHNFLWDAWTCLHLILMHTRLRLHLPRAAVQMWSCVSIECLIKSKSFSFLFAWLARILESGVQWITNRYWSLEANNGLVVSAISPQKWGHCSSMSRRKAEMTNKTVTLFEIL